MQAFDNFMMRTDIIVTIVLIVYAALWIVFFYIVYLVIKALKVYIRSKEVRQEMAVVKKTLGRRHLVAKIW